MRLITPLFSLLLFASCNKEQDYVPSTYLNAQEQYDCIWKIIRYVARKPEGAGNEDKFDKKYDPHYREQMGLHALDAFYPAQDGRKYFLISRRAPSVGEKRVATGGYFKQNTGSDLIQYRETFRTWKMVPDTLMRRSFFLFASMVQNEDLSPYYSSNSGNTDYIEFPDDRTYFDTTERTWKTR